MANQIKYVDPETGYEWVANFESQDEALAQAVEDTRNYGGTPAAEIVDGRGATVVTHEEIISASEE